MFKNTKSTKNQKDNELKFLNYIQPIIEIIVQDIIKTRITKDKEKDNILIHYKTNNNKYIDLTQTQDNNQQDSHIFELNIYILYKKQNISFIVEHWKFKIDSTPSLNNELREIHKLRIKKKLLTLFRSIKCMEKLLPLNSLIKKNSFDLSFQVQIYKKSDIEINPEKNEKKQINLEAKDEKYGSVKLSINYYTIDGIISHEENIKKNMNYFDFYNNFYSQLSLQKTGKSKFQQIQQDLEKTQKKIINKEKDINNDIIKDNNVNDNGSKIEEKEEIDESENFSALFEENELVFSNLIESKILDKKGNIKKSEIEEEIKEIKKGNSKEQLNLDELYSSCFNNIEDINFQQNLGEILNKNNLMNKENKKLNDIKDKYDLYFKNNELLYDKIKGFEFNDIIINHPKNIINKKKEFIIDSNYFGGENNNTINNNQKEEKELFKEIVSDYIENKKLLNK